ncbi:hypothetical protein YPPY32_2137, partial [Yersinia pestis PY-32]
MKYHRVSP